MNRRISHHHNYPWANWDRLGATVSRGILPSSRNAIYIDLKGVMLV